MFLVKADHSGVCDIFAAERIKKGVSPFYPVEYVQKTVLIFTWSEQSKRAFITIEEECTVAMLCDDVFEYTNTTS